MMSTKSPARRSEPEIAMMEQLADTLDNHIVEPPPSLPPLHTPAPTVVDASKDVTKNVLAAHFLKASIVRICYEEKVVVGEGDAKTLSDSFLDAIVDQYKTNYPTLTAESIKDAIARHTPSVDEPVAAVGMYDEPADEQHKLGHCIAKIDGAMDAYYDKIASMKRTREYNASVVSASSPPPKKRRMPDGKKASTVKVEGVESVLAGVIFKKDSSEEQLLGEITRRYTIERERHGKRIPNNCLNDIVATCKKEMGMEHFDLPVDTINKRVRVRYHAIKAKEEKTSGGIAAAAADFRKEGDPHREFQLYEQIYARYSSEKRNHNGKLPKGLFDQIIEGAKMELGLPDCKVSRQKISLRFARENPEMTTKAKANESSEHKRKRQTLLNAIVKRYVNERERHGKKLPDGTLNTIIEETKTELGIHDVNVPHDTIRGRIARRSLNVMTLGGNAPYSEIDSTLVDTINRWLGQGISVTRVQGLELANSIRKGLGLGNDGDDDIVLDSKWWRNFLERNKTKLKCATD
mmetsp:Transcript_19767/g.42506  ORF Transcript_19767/g.42506 Transcript_19767/m.42506 type:complete len:520 (+) Transcript_19767:86-1645(+)